MVLILWMVGPILLSNDAIVEALKTEIVYKATDILKSRILREVSALFENPGTLYAGLGNRENVI